MNEDNYNSNGDINVSDGSLEEDDNQKVGSYSYKFNSYNFANENNNQNTYVGGYQQNMGKTLVRRRERSGTFGNFRNNRLSGYVSVLGIAIILGILVLVISFFAN